MHSIYIDAHLLFQKLEYSILTVTQLATPAAMQPLAAGGGVSWPLYAATVAAALLVTAIVLRLAARSTAAACKARPPAGSLGWPLVGETLQFISAAYSSRPESFVEKRCRRWAPPPPPWHRQRAYVVAASVVLKISLVLVDWLIP